ncbi:hypothetical protein LUZ60_012667 [Juncus effusus]|nr:hypothetical protein LUZ60_012667 [Juncus effusus]
MVSPDTIRTAIGVLGNAIALVLFLSPVPTFYKIWKKRSVEQFSPIPYIATLMNCMMWVLYGLPIVHPHSLLVITINGAGTFIELSYILLFLLYSQGKKRLQVLAMFVGAIVFVAIVAVVVITTAHTHERRSMIVGILCVILCIMMYAAPLSVMKMVIQTKSVEYMPLFLSVAAFFNGVCWTVYALIRFDPYITIPNGLGVVFAIGQLILYAIYYKSTQRQIEERRRKAEMLTEVVAMENGNSKAGSTAPGSTKI